jgi:hypothetical protein
LRTTRIRTLSVRGFRAYGAAEQSLNLPSDIAVVWGANSTGKTSLAEAFEFLLTGRISRRELMASSQDEFADALRNAHLAADKDVFVKAQIMGPDGSTHEIKRILTSDYAKRQDCTSNLEIDGVTATEADLGNLGIVLSQPPLQAPVLAQHTLGYIFSVRPQDRSTYFKALLEVTDLDDLRNLIATLSDVLTLAEDPLLTKLDACLGVASLKPFLAGLLVKIPDLESLKTKIADAARALIEEAGDLAPHALDDKLAKIEDILAERRSKTFPVRGFERKELAGWNAPSADTWGRLDTYIIEREKVDEETRQLSTLFAEALKIPRVSLIAVPIECPVCSTEAALTPDRVKIIRQHVADTKDFNVAESAAKSALTLLATSADALMAASKMALPWYLKSTAAERRKLGFTVARIRELLGDRADEFVAPWLAEVVPLARVATATQRDAKAASELVKSQTSEIATALNPEELQAAFAALTPRQTTLAAAFRNYNASEAPLLAALRAVLDAQSDTAGWQEFLDIARQPEGLHDALIERYARTSVEKELEIALKQIDRAKEVVLDEKFAEYSDSILDWWERLRPDEATFFAAVQPRKGAKRTIDFKAGLSANPDRSAPKVRDVIAVFSQSQLQCLGLALFLARAEYEGLGFIILDDPVLSSDEDYRVHFNSTVLSELLKLPMQVVVLTQDHDTWEEVETRYRHLGISTAQLFTENRAEGTIIENTSDALLAKITRAKSLARGGHPDSRKECGIQLRDAGERFCKEMLVKDRRTKGDAAASLTDYDGKTLEWLCPRVDPLLGHDPSHPGKLEVFKNTVNDACHDNVPPGTAAMIHACGEIGYFQKEYLAR